MDNGTEGQPRVAGSWLAENKLQAILAAVLVVITASVVLFIIIVRPFDPASPFNGGDGVHPAPVEESSEGLGEIREFSFEAVDTNNENIEYHEIESAMRSALKEADIYDGCISTADQSINTACVNNNIDRLAAELHITEDKNKMQLLNFEKAKVHISAGNYDEAYIILQLDESTIPENLKHYYYGAMSYYYRSIGDAANANRYTEKAAAFEEGGWG